MRAENKINAAPIACLTASQVLAEDEVNTAVSANEERIAADVTVGRVSQFNHSNGGCEPMKESSTDRELLCNFGFLCDIA